MQKNELHVAIPSYFRCPISLEVMSSPVALCTGITYDRSSIQTWLDSGNLICPATMQPLPSPTFVPNLALHRLIQLWSLSRSPSPYNLSVLVNRITCSVTSSSVNARDLSLCLMSVFSLARDSEENRRFLAGSERFIAAVVHLMDRFDAASGEFRYLESIVMILDLVLRQSEKSRDQIYKLFFKSDLRCLTPIVAVMRAGKAESRISATNVLEAIAIDNEAKRRIAGTEGLLAGLYDLIISDDDSAIQAGLSTLIALVMTRSFKADLVQLGTVPVLGSILAGSSRSAPVIERAMEMAELLSKCSEGRSAICNDERCVGEITRRLMKVSEKATEHGIAVIWCLCHVFRNKKAVAAVARSNGLAKCLLVMQSNCSAVVRQMCRDLVKVVRVDSVTDLASYDTKTIHIMPC